MRRKLLKEGISNNMVFALRYLMKKTQKVVLSLMMVFMLAGSILPQNPNKVYALDIPTEDIGEESSASGLNLSDYPTTTDPDFDPSSVEIESEIIEERALNSKVFRKIDGTYEQAFYDDTIHYLDNGKLKNINNSLIYDELNDLFETQDNAFKLKFPKKLDDNKTIKLFYDDYSIDWNVLNIDSVDILVDEEKASPNNIKELTNINQKVLYADIQDNVDIEYIVTGSKIKENIILNEYVENFSITFEYKLKNLDIVTDSEGNINFVNEASEVVFTFADFVMFDSEFNDSTNLQVDFVKLSDTTYKIMITPDDNWLKTANYPVVVDPSITFYGDSDMIDARYVFASSYNDYGTALKVGYNGNYNYRSYVEFDLTQIPSDTIVNYAHLRIQTLSNSNYCTNNCTILAKEVDSGYSMSQMVGEDLNVTNDRVIDYEEVLYADGDTETYKWDITRNFQEWLFNGDTSRIIELSKKEESVSGYIIFNSLNSIIYGPVLVIGYEYTNGLHDYWTYSQQPISTAGTGYVSDYTGELTLIRNDLNFQTDKQSLSLSMVYNINDKATNIGYGAGWRTNYNIEARLDTANNRYYSIDATGAKTYYVSTACDSRYQDDAINDYACYLAEDGSRNMFVTLEERGTNEIIDYFLVTLEQVHYHFGYDGYLDTVYDKKTGLYTYIEYDIIGSRILIDTVTDDTGNYIDLVYDYENNLHYSNLYVLVTEGTPNIYDKLEYVSYGTYSYETEIDEKVPRYVYHYTDYDDNESFTLDYYSIYDHDTNGRLLYGQSTLGSKTVYTYDSTSDRISTISSYIDSGKIAEVEYTYDFKKTTITNYNDDESYYWFDNYGHTIQIMTSDGFVQTFKYLNIFSLSGYYDTYIDINGIPNYRQNHIKIYESTPEYAYFDPILNGGFEEYENATNDPNWDFVIDDLNGYSPTFISHEYNDTESIYGDFSAFASVYNGQDVHYEQDIILDSGTYNVSGYIKVLCNDGEAFITVDGATFNTYDVIVVEDDGEWHYVDLPFTVATDNTTVTIKLNRIENGSGGSVYFDSIQLLEGYRNTRTNLMENPSFENSLSGWTLSSGVAGAGISSQTSGVYEDILRDNGIVIVGNENEARSASYDITDLLDLTSDNIYTIKVWSKSEGTPTKCSDSSGDRAYYMVIEYTILGATLHEFSSVSFDPGLEEWQVLSIPVTITDYTTNVKIHLAYQGLGTVYFDGVTLESGISGTYNEISISGNVVKTIKERFIEAHYDYLVDDDGQASEKPLDSRATNVSTEVNDTEIPLDSSYRPEYFENNNVKITPTYDSETGQTTQLKFGDNVNYFTTSTSYLTGSFKQYKLSTTNEFGKSTTYDFDLVTGLLDSVTNSDDVITEYEYYDDGLLHKVMNNDYCDEQSPTTCAVTEYVYDSDNMLIKIIMADGYYYQIYYNSQNRMSSVYIKNDNVSYSNQLMGYTYVYENGVYTSKINTQTYEGNDDFISFDYNDNDQISAIKHNNSSGVATTRFSYEYDQLGRVAVYNTHNSENGTVINTEYYTYNTSGQLIYVSDNEGNRIEYGYDDYGNLSKLNFDIDSSSQETLYFYNKYLDFDGIDDDLQSSLYDKTTYNTQDNQTVEKEYFYENNALYKLDYINLMNGTFTITQNFSFVFDTTRINFIEYNIDKTSDQTIDTIVRYKYYYDDLGNISSIKYYLNDLEDEKLYLHYEYDEMNQLHVVDSRDYEYDYDELSDTNYTKYYYYDLRGNITDVKTFLYGQNDTNTYTIPSFYENSTGSTNVKVYYNGTTNDCYDIYNLSLGQNPSVTISLYNLDTGTWITGLVLVNETYSTLDINTEGYYYKYYTAMYKLSVYTEFRIVFKVGNPVNGPTTPQKHLHYNYSSDWLDQMSDYVEYTYDANGDIDSTTTVQMFSYDDQGNPTTISDFFYDDNDPNTDNFWNHANLEYDGRQLTSITIYSDTLETNIIDTIVYTYNDQGYRTSKTVDGVTIEYYLQNDKVLYETDGTYGIIYTYDFDGTLISFNYDDDVNSTPTGTEYFYLQNQQGDITHIVDEDGEIVVEYEYDAWGNITKITDSTSNSLSEINPYLYRGYRYNKEINIYYLNSRYYNPVLGRFTNADSILGKQGDISSHNTYTYCINNPINYYDSDGRKPVRISFFDTDEDPNLSPNMADWFYVYGFYIETDASLSFNPTSSSSGKAGVKIGVGVMSFGFRTGPIFRDNDFVSFNPEFTLQINVIYASAEASLNFQDGIGIKLEAELLSINGSIHLTYNFSVSGKIRVGFGVALKVSGTNAKLGIGWWEISFDYE